ncbi:MAG: H-NS family nucleoid-associated regulatory protein [Granulosicoccus sp.]
MSENYSNWSIEKLKKERQKIEKAIQLAEKRDKKATLVKMAAIAKQNGFELHELLSDSAMLGTVESKSRATPKVRKPRGKVAPKYRNPDNKSQTWTGRGRQPLWVKGQLDSGVMLDDLKIS